MRILIADDDFTSRMILAQVLKKQGHEVVQAEDGLAAWEVLRGPGAPRLAILDWVMPGLEGPELVRKVRALGETPPPYLIILTGQTEAASIQEGLDAGADAFLTKPLDPAELKARLEAGQGHLDRFRG